MIDSGHIKGFRVKLSSDPFEHGLVFFVIWIGDSIQEHLVSWRSPIVLGRARIILLLYSDIWGLPSLFPAALAASNLCLVASEICSLSSWFSTSMISSIALPMAVEVSKDSWMLIRSIPRFLRSSMKKLASRASWPSRSTLNTRSPGALPFLISFTISCHWGRLLYG